VTCAPVRILRLRHVEPLRVHEPGADVGHVLERNGASRCGAPLSLEIVEAPADWPTCTLCARRQPKEQR
jgi:hypothetical protein